MMRSKTGSSFEEEFGFVPRFFVEGSAGSFGSLHEAVQACSSPEIDYFALDVFFRTGFFLRGATPFKRIRRHAPAPLIVALDWSLSREQAIDAFIDVFRSSVARLVTPESVIGLSGGRDSRHIVLELAHQRALPDYAVTVDLANSNDLEIARRLCLALGLEQRVFGSSFSHGDERWKNIVTNLSSTQMAPFCVAARARDHRAWWDGIGGDVLSAGLFLESWNLDLFRQGKIDELAERLVARRSMPKRSGFPGVAREDVLQLMRQELELHRTAANPVGSFYFWNRTRVDIASCAFVFFARSGQTTLAPYLDRDVYQLLSSLPAEYLLDHTFHTEAISRAYPDFRNLPYSAKRALPKPTAAGVLMHLMDVLRGTLDTEHLSRTYTLTRGIGSLLLPSRGRDPAWMRRRIAYLQSVEEMQALPRGQAQLRGDGVQHAV